MGGHVSAIPSAGPDSAVSADNNENIERAITHLVSAYKIIKPTITDEQARAKILGVLNDEGSAPAVGSVSQVVVPIPINHPRYITVSQMVGIFEQILKEKGDIPVVIRDDDSCAVPIYPTEIMAWVEKTGGYDPKGFFVPGEEGPEVCVVACP